jgi:hypothetical protein
MAASQPSAAIRGLAAGPHSSTPNAVGLYNYFDGNIITEGGQPTTLTINANGTFTLLYSSLTDTGVWVQQGKTIALTVTSGEDGSAGCLLLGTVERKGLSSATKQGVIDCMVPFGKSGSWYAPIPRHVR